MRQNLYTHVPVLNEQNKVIGVFDENSILHILQMKRLFVLTVVLNSQI